MPRALALFALSLFVSLTVTAVVTLIARSAVTGVAIRCRGKGEEVAA